MLMLRPTGAATLTPEGTRRHGGERRRDMQIRPTTTLRDDTHYFRIARPTRARQRGRPTHDRPQTDRQTDRQTAAHTYAISKPSTSLCTESGATGAVFSAASIPCHTIGISTRTWAESVLFVYTTCRSFSHDLWFPTLFVQSSSRARAPIKTIAVALLH